MVAPLPSAPTFSFSNQGQPSILRDQKIRNSYYGLSYYNTLASLWKRAHENHESNCIIMHEIDSAVMALRNPLNGSHDIINLRDTLVKRGMCLYLAIKEGWTGLTGQLFELSNSDRMGAPPILTTKPTTG